MSCRVRAIRQQPQLDLILAPMQVIGEPWVRCRYGSRQPVHVDECLAVGMLSVRADRLRAAGGFPHTAYGEDAAPIQVLQRNCTHQAWIEERSYVYYRDHGGGLTAQWIATINRRRPGTVPASPSWIPAGT